MGITLDGEFGWDDISDRLFVKKIENMETMEEKLNYVKFLYLKDNDKYFRWKSWCRRKEKLPDIFGTLDDPIPIDESKL